MNLTMRYRGICPVCGYSARLRANGAMGLHRVYIGNDGRRCAGEGEYPKRPGAVFAVTDQARLAREPR